MSQFAASSMERAAGAGTPVRLWKSATLSSSLIVVALIVTLQTCLACVIRLVVFKILYCMAAEMRIDEDRSLD